MLTSSGFQKLVEFIPRLIQLEARRWDPSYIKENNVLMRCGLEHDGRDWKRGTEEENAHTWARIPTLRSNPQPSYARISRRRLGVRAGKETSGGKHPWSI